MLLRAFLIMLLSSPVWSSGISIELSTQISIGTVTYCDTESPSDDCSPQQKFGSIQIDPDSVEPRAPTFFSIPKIEPDAISITVPKKTEDEGIESREYSSVGFTLGSEVKFMQQYAGKLGVYSNDGIVHFYEFDFETSNPSITFDYVPPVTADSFSIIKLRFSEYNRIPEEQELPLRERTPVSRYMPIVINKTQGVLYDWNEDFIYSERFEGNFHRYDNHIDAFMLESGLKPIILPSNLYNQLKGFNEYASGSLFAFANEDNQGLWLNGRYADGEGDFVSQQVSNISMDHSQVDYTQWGLTQFFIGDQENVLYAKLLEWSELPTYEFKSIQNVASLEVKATAQGTLLKIIETSDSIKYFFWGYSTLVEVTLPPLEDLGVSQSIDFCDSTQGKIYCIVQLDAGEIDENSLNVYEYKLYELIDGHLVFDRDVHSPALKNGYLGIKGIYAYGENRLLFVNTLDLRHRVFNVMPEKTHFVGVSGSSGLSWRVEVVEDQFVPGVVYWIFYTTGGLSAYKYTLNLNEPEPEPEISTPDLGDSNDLKNEEGRDIEEEEEEPFVRPPQAELSGALSVYYLFSISLLLLIGRRRKLNL